MHKDSLNSWNSWALAKMRAPKASFLQHGSQRRVVAVDAAEDEHALEWTLDRCRVVARREVGRER